MIYAATGHRPEVLSAHPDYRLRAALRLFAVSAVRALGPVDHFVVGMAQGWDMAVAHAAVHLGLPFVAAVPFEGQAQYWAADAQAEYAYLLKHARSVVTVYKSAKTQHDRVRAYHQRDEYMVDVSNGLLALWNGQREGGTAYTWRYAVKRRRKAVNVWQAWQENQRMTPQSVRASIESAGQHETLTSFTDTE